MLHPHELDTHVQALITQLPDVPVLIEPGQAEAVLSSADATLIMGLPMCWCSVRDGRHSIKTNRLLIGLHLVQEGLVSSLAELPQATKTASRQLIEALMQRLESVDMDGAVIHEFEPTAAKGTVLSERLELLEAAAARLAIAPRFLVARIMGRILH